MDRQELESARRKFEERSALWKSAGGAAFATPAAQQTYQRHVQMVLDAIQLKKPERVPVCPSVGFYQFTYSGVTAREGMYDYARLAYAVTKYHRDFLPDSLSGSPIYGSGKLFDILDYRLYNWPGHGVPETAPYQCVEAEYMLADEYDRLIQDPSDYFARFYLPRVFGALEGWRNLGPLTDILELPLTGGPMVAFGLPAVQQSLRKLIEAGDAAMEWIQACSAIDGEIRDTLGLPGLIGCFSKAPFDTLGDTLRGTRAIMLDRFRRPAKLLAALERLTPLAIELGVRGADARRHPLCFIPLHKGADGFLSDADFKKFYWPTLKALILGLIKEGVVPYLFAEGGYNQRLDVITDPDIPPGATVWLFDKTDLKEVKKRFTGWACFSGNVPVSLLKAARPEQVRDYVKRLIDEVAGDGGFILATGAVVDDAEPENLHALIDTGKEYGVYR